jgi:hypothetical protein
MIHIEKVCITNKVFENEFQNIIRYFSLISKNYFENPNPILHLFKFYANILAKELFTKGLIPNKFCNSKVCFKIKFRCYFIRFYSPNLKEFMLITLTNFALLQ